MNGLRGVICLRNFCDKGLVIKFHYRVLVGALVLVSATGAPIPESGICVGSPMRTDN